MRKERTYSTGRSTLTLGISLAIIMIQVLSGNIGHAARSKIIGPAASAGATVAP